MCENLINKYLVGDQWNELLINMWKAYQEAKDSLSTEEAETILLFAHQCIVFIRKCVQLNILQVNPSSGKNASFSPLVTPPISPLTTEKTEFSETRDTDADSTVSDSTIHPVSVLSSFHSRLKLAQFLFARRSFDPLSS